MDGTTDELCYEELRHDVTFAILVSQNNKTGAMLVSQNSPVGVFKLLSFVNSFLGSNKFAKLLATRVKTYLFISGICVSLCL